MQPSSNDEYLTVNEVAELLKLNPQTVRNWIDRHELPAIRVGARRVRVRRTDLDAYLAAGSTDPGHDQQPRVDQGERAGDGAARADLAGSLDRAREALGDDDAGLVQALRSLSEATIALADKIDAAEVPR